MRIEFLVQCPRCHNKMKYSPSDKRLIKKVKRCVYCGRSFVVQKNITK